VLLGNVKENEKLILVWQNKSNIDCPRVEHRNNQNKQYIWLLKEKAIGEVAADNSGRIVSVENKKSVLELLRERDKSNKSLDARRNTYFL
jgi:aminoglycoside phosphotransferase